MGYIIFEATNQLDPSSATIRGRRFQRNFSIISTFWATNPSTKKRDRVRLVYGEPSIWASEQPEYSKTEIRWEKPRFKDGYFWVDDTDTRMIECLEIHPQNEKSTSSLPKLFRKVDIQKNEAKKLNRLEDEYKAVQIAMNVEGIKFEILCDTLNVFGETVKGKRASLYEYAKNAPSKFMEAYDDPKSEVVFNLKKAVLADIIRVNPAKDLVLWADSGLTICNIPVGADPLSTFARNILSDDKFRGIYSDIINKMKLETPQNVNLKDSVDSYSPNDYMEEISVSDLVKQAVDNGVITQGGKLNKELYFEGELLGMGVKASSIKLEETPRLLERLKVHLAAID